MIAEHSKSYQLAADLLKRLNQLDWIPILLVRLSVGLLFFESGRGKLFVKFDELVEYFVELGIPFPYPNALVTASIEFVGGICLILGVATRIFSAPLAHLGRFSVSTRSAVVNDICLVGIFRARKGQPRSHYRTQARPWELRRTSKRYKSGETLVE
jgi:hypothetical protein